MKKIIFLVGGCLLALAVILAVSFRWQQFRTAEQHAKLAAAQRLVDQARADSLIVTRRAQLAQELELARSSIESLILKQPALDSLRRQALRAYSEAESLIVANDFDRAMRYICAANSMRDSLVARKATKTRKPASGSSSIKRTPAPKDDKRWIFEQ